MKDKGDFKLGRIVVISAAHHIHDIYTSFLAPVLPLLIDKLSISFTQAGLLNVIQRVPSLLNPFIGIIAENLKVRYFVIIAPAITALCMSMIGVAPTYGVLALLLFVSGLSSAFFHIPTPVLIKRLAGDKLGRGMSFYMVGGEFARSVGPMAILGAVSLWGLGGSYRLAPVGIITSLVLFYKLKDVDVNRNPELKYEGVGYAETFRKYLPVFLSIAVLTMFWGAMKSSLTLFLPTYLKFKGTSLWFAGASLSVLQLAGATGTFISGSFSDRMGRKKTLFIISLVLPLLMLLFVSMKGVAVMPVLLLTGLFLFAPTPIFLAIIHELDTDHLPFVNGVFMTINFFMNSAMMLLVGYFSDKIGLDITFKLSAAAAVFAIPAVWMMKKRY